MCSVRVHQVFRHRVQLCNWLENEECRTFSGKCSSFTDEAIGMSLMAGFKVIHGEVKFNVYLNVRGLYVHCISLFIESQHFIHAVFLFLGLILMFQ